MMGIQLSDGMLRHAPNACKHLLETIPSQIYAGDLVPESAVGRGQPLQSLNEDLDKQGKDRTPQVINVLCD